MSVAPSSAACPEFIKLLAHDLRWKLLRMLCWSDYRVQELAQHFQQPQNLTSYHLKRLRNMHVVIEHRSAADARDVYYHLDLVQLERCFSAAGAALHPALRSWRKQTPHRSQATAGRPLCVLLLCTGNSARSQMAEGMMRHWGGRRVEVLSAGTAPSKVHPFAIRAMAELGIDIRGQRSKHVDEFSNQRFDYIITVCDRMREACPEFPSDPRYIHWSLPDPDTVAGSDQLQYQAFSQTARELMTRIRYFLIQVDGLQEEPHETTHSHSLHRQFGPLPDGGRTSAPPSR